MDTNDLKSMIGRKIYELRQEYDLTQEEFSNKLRIYTAHSHISRIESGAVMPSAEFIRAVCINFSISPLWLLGIDAKLDTLSSKGVKFLSLFNSLTTEAQDSIINLMTVMNKIS